jgi:hypothetical protein
MAIVTGADVAAALGLPSTTATLDGVAAVADQLITPYVTTTGSTDPVPAPVREAGIVMAIDILQNRTAAGGQSVGMDGQPGPYRMGASLLARVQGLLGPWLDVRGDLR